MTVMFIPHGKESVISLHINLAMIIFLSGIVVMAVILSGYGFYRQAMLSKRDAAIRQKHGENLGTALKINSQTRSGIELREQLLENLLEISTLIGMHEDDIATLPTKKYSVQMARLSLQQPEERKGLTPINDYIPPVYSLRSLHNMLSHNSALLLTLQENIKNGMGAYDTMPMGRPVRMNGMARDSSGFGVRRNPVTGVGYESHTGMDMAGPQGTPIYSTGTGTVHQVTRSSGGYGNSIIIQHEYGYFTLFAHLTSINVRKGEQVYRGQRIGTMGRTGRTTGSHLHYEVRMNNKDRVDPLPFVCSLDMYSPRCNSFHQKYNNL